MSVSNNCHIDPSDSEKFGGIIRWLTLLVIFLYVQQQDIGM